MALVDDGHPLQPPDEIDWIIQVYQRLRPVMIALGTASTGVDLADKSIPDDRTEKDWLLTDLVIACIPIGCNRSNTMIRRTERMGLYPVIQESLLTLKQGFDRLIRRDGVRDRRLWMIDGRL